MWSWPRIIGHHSQHDLRCNRRCVAKTRGFSNKDRPMTTIFTEITKFFQGLRPLDRITVSQWADKYRFCHRSAPQNRDSTERAIPLTWCDIMDCLSVHDPHRKLSLSRPRNRRNRGRQQFCRLFHAHRTGAHHVRTANRQNGPTIVQGAHRPADRELPELKQRVAPAKSRDSNNTITQKEFPPAACCWW